MIGIIADTHDNVLNILKAVEVFKAKKVDFVIHCGDLIAPATLKFFAGLKMKLIFGNCDGDRSTIKKMAADLGWDHYGDLLETTYNNKRICAVHGKDQIGLDRLIYSKEYDFVFHGHTHKKRNEKILGVHVINPGAHYYGCENTIAIVDLEKDKVEFVDLSEEIEKI